MTRRMMGWILPTLCLGLGAGGCGADATVIDENGTQGTAGTAGAAPVAAEPPPCVDNPVTHAEIINACTSAVKIRKTPALTLLNPDGTLPPL